MSFRTFHFDGVVRVPSYVEWLLESDMRETYAYPPARCSNCCSGTASRICGTCARRCTCSPSTPSSRRIPNAKFLWSHRDPAKVLGSVCSLIAYVRSWSSDRKDPEELGRRATGLVGRGHRACHGLPQEVRRRPLRRRLVRRPADRPGQDGGRQLREAGPRRSPIQRARRCRSGPTGTSPVSVARTPTSWPITG